MSRYRIRLEGLDESLDARVMRIEVDGRMFQTPAKPVDPSAGTGILESAPRITEDSVLESIRNGSPLSNVSKRLPHDGELRVIIPSYQSIGISDAVFRHLENNIHPYTDLVAVPRWDAVLSRDNSGNILDDLWVRTEMYVEEVRRINGKPILGNLPLNRSQTVIDELLNRCVDIGITSFVMDFEGCNAMGRLPAIRGVMKSLSDYGCLDESLLYSVNVRRSHDCGDIKPADDFLMFIRGFDIMGNYHLRGGGDRSIVKVFDSVSWAYRDEEALGRRANEVGSENRRRMNREADTVRQQILETGTVLNLARTKRGAGEYLGSKAQTTLDMHGIRFGQTSLPRTR